MIKVLIGSEVALREVEEIDLTSLSGSFQFFVTDVLNCILERKGISLSLSCEILETSFAGYIESVRNGLATGFDESFQYLILYSIDRDENTDLKIVVENSWFDVNSVADTGKFLSVSALKSNLEECLRVDLIDRIYKRVDEKFDIRNPILSALVEAIVDDEGRYKRIKEKFAQAVHPDAFEFLEKVHQEELGRSDFKINSN